MTRFLEIVTARKIILLLIGTALLASCSITPKDIALEGAPAHHTTRGFKNIYVEDPEKTFFSFMRLRLFGDDKWADHSKTAGNVPFQMLELERIETPPEDLQVSWLGHSTFLIQYQGVNILTDPMFSNRASPVSFSGPKRYVPHVVNYALLPPIDYVIISHNHYDHLDDTAIKVLGNNPHYFVPLGVRDWFLDQGVDGSRVQELDWWQIADPVRTGPSLRIEAQPSQHWSARGLYDRRKTLWASWHITLGGKTLWFAGDTGYNKILFKEIGEKNGPVDLGLIPIGAYAPRSFMKTYHVDPDEAVMIHKDIGAVQSIGMHWGTYSLTAEEPMDPPLRLEAARLREGLGPLVFRTISVGQTVTLH